MSILWPDFWSQQQIYLNIVASGGPRPGLSGLPGLEHWSDFPSLIAGWNKTGIIKSSHQYLLLMDKANKALSLLVSVFLRITTSKIPGVFYGRRMKNYPISYHIGNHQLSNLVKSLFSFSITCCIPSEPWWVCTIQRLNYSGSIRSLYFVNNFGTSPGQM